MKYKGSRFGVQKEKALFDVGIERGALREAKAPLSKGTFRTNM